MGEMIRAMSRDGFIRICSVDTTDIVRRAAEIHKTSALASAALGRALTAASILGSGLKGENDSLTMQIRGGGPLGTITAVSDSAGNVRGYLQNPFVELPEKRPGKLNVGAGVGVDGSLTVIKDLGLKEPYVGSCPLVSGEIAEDVTQYLATSEQIPSAVALGVLVDKDLSITTAGGYIVELLPGADDSLIDRLEENINSAGPVTELLPAYGVEGMAKKILDGFDPEIVGKTKVEYHCFCSKKRVEKALISMGRKDLQEIADEGKGVEMTCQFCDAVYHFTPEELKKLLKAL